jgi:hypothetical protein
MRVMITCRIKSEASALAVTGPSANPGFLGSEGTSQRQTSNAVRLWTHSHMRADTLPRLTPSDEAICAAMSLSTARLSRSPEVRTSRCTLALMSDDDASLPASLGPMRSICKRLRESNNTDLHPHRVRAQFVYLPMRKAHIHENTQELGQNRTSTS